MSQPILLSLCALTLAGAAVGQSGRTMRLNAPAVIGKTARFAMRHPVGAAGNLYTLVWSPPFAGAVPLSVPGLTVNGLVRVDLANAVPVVSGVLASSGMTPDLQVPIPNDPRIVGYAWDLQGVDLSGANVLTLADDDLEIVVSSPPLPVANLVLIAPGAFRMGSNATSQAPYFSSAWERPVHRVAISRPFWMGQYEVTQMEYQAVMGVNPSHFVGASYPNSANQPVETVSWNDAMAYCAALTLQEAAAGRLPSGYQYRLPTEAEWEYCCRAGTTTEFHYGPSLVCGQATFGYSYHSNSYCLSNNTVVVGSFAPNAWRLFDMHGNVWDWCLDAWDGSANYPSSAVVDPFVSGSSSGPFRVARGGAWSGFSSDCRSANRSGGDPNLLSYGVGFRVVLAPVLTP
jgi:formylglycine-generating enzyme required for sulfatase activity